MAHPQRHHEFYFKDGNVVMQVRTLRSILLEPGLNAIIGRAHDIPAPSLLARETLSLLRTPLHATST